MRRYFNLAEGQFVEELVDEVIGFIDIDTIIHFGFIINNSDINRE